jgi:hypothetical protein
MRDKIIQITLYMTKELLIHILKSVSLYDLSGYIFEYGSDDNEHWCNAMDNGRVADAILWDGNIFKMLDNNGDFHPLNPMVSAFEAMKTFKS